MSDLEWDPNTEDEQPIEAEDEEEPIDEQDEEDEEEEEEETMPVDESISTNTTQLAAPDEKKRKRVPKPVGPLTHDPGKSLLPFARVQRVLKADSELPKVAREATFLISMATELFVQRLAVASQTISQREKRTTVQQKDVATVVRRADEFLFLEELIGFPTNESASGKRKPKALQKSSNPMMDSFLQRSASGAGFEESIQEDDDL